MDGAPIRRAADLNDGMAGRIYVGTAGWSVPRASAHRFASVGTHLQRYARVFLCTEINSAFWRSHLPATYARWAAATPDEFRFAVKVPRVITHEHRLRRSRAPFERFLAETAGLDHRRGPLLVQLPPSLDYEPRTVARFFDVVRQAYAGPVVCEPRHPTWFAPGPDKLMRRQAVARVAADPGITEAADAPGGWNGLAYFRLHGSPRPYWSRYDRTYVARLAARIRQIAATVDVWCVFDNTASGAALENAWELRQLLDLPGAPVHRPAARGKDRRR